jgi:hypothetical protein
MMDLVRLHRLFNNSGTLCLLRFSNGSTNNLRRSASRARTRMTVTFDHGLPVSDWSDRYPGR